MGNPIIGVIGLVVASVCWGSNFIVVKGYDMKDGFAFQFWLCTGILIVGLLCVFAAEPEPGYAPGDGKLGALNLQVSMLGVLGGALWAMGNLCTVAIINSIGLGLGLSLWGGINLVSSFIIGRMGPCIGDECLDVKPLALPALGGVGCGLSVLALVAFGFVKPQLKDDDKHVQLLDATAEVVVPIESAPAAQEKGDRFQRLRGIALALLAGSVYGLQFLPGAIYNQNHNESGQLAGQIRFFFSQYLGIFLTSLLAFVVYAAWHTARGVPLPEVTLRAMLPAMLSGIMWALAGAGVMFAITELGYSVGFPLALNGSFLVNVLWSVFYYKEVRGRRNLALFSTAAVLDIVASFMISLSK